LSNCASRRKSIPTFPTITDPSAEVNHSDRKPAKMKKSKKESWLSLSSTSSEFATKKRRGSNSASQYKRGSTVKDE